ncbi:hypothetical protein, conserved [Babesia bigemina]|uniref:C3H1-type domain-containing protein n=1 Tax=Babesia bigemina TaxID=5866 RepID=A0A061BJK2_BABBI|nr:hypothetical protein, conserved [Babesia bigemina]CDR71674.1 hypothetical protein, conserved [Babesia bigemina]|eukprot:XP_012770621.1 hypothetical protein, conserved [Babesia bigemina]
MGFLSGVLGAVKNENEVITYDNNLQTKLKDVLDTLNTKIGSGRTGLAVSVGAVREWLEGYEGEVKKRTENVKKRLNALRTIIANTTSEIDSLKNSKLETQLSHWKTTVGEMDKWVEETEREHISKLNGALQVEIKRELKPIKTVINVLHESAQNDLFQWQAGQVDSVLVKQMTEIVTGINDLREEKQKHFISIYGRLKNAEVFLKNDLDREYRDVITKKFENLKLQMAQIDPDNVLFGAYNKNSQIYQEVNDITTKLRTTGEELKSNNDNLNAWKREAEKAISKAKQKVTDVVDVLHGREQLKENNVTKRIAVETAAKVLNDEAKILMRAIEAAKGNLSTTVAAAQSAIRDVDGSLKDGLHRLKTGINAGIRSYVQKLADAFTAGIPKAGWSGREGFNAFKGVMKGNTLNSDSKFGEQLEDIGFSNPDLALAIETALKYFNQQKAAWDKKSKDLASALTQDLNDKVEAFLPKDKELVGSSEKVGLEQLLPYSSNHGTGSKKDLDAKVRAIEGVDKILDNINYPEGKGNKLNMKHISEAHNDIRKKFNEYTGTVEKLLHGDLSFSTKDHLNFHLMKLSAMLTDNVTLYSDVTHGLETIHKELQDIYNNELSTKPGNIQTVINSVLTKIKKLEDIPADIEKKKEEAVNKMAELKAEVETYIVFIRQAVEQAERAFSDAVNAVLIAVKSSFNFITIQFRKFFADGRKADQVALKKLVDEQVPIIKSIIDDDKRNGIKGLLKWLYDAKGSRLSQIVTTLGPPAQPKDYSEKFMTLSTKFEDYADVILAYVEHQAMTPGKTASLPTDQSERVRDIKTVLDNLLGHLTINDTKIHNFDHIYVSYLTALNDSLNKLSPTFSSPSPLLAPLKAGLSKFAEQLGHAYVNRYSGQKYTALTEQKQVPDPKQPGTDQKITVDVLTPEGRNCAKVCLTIVEMVTKNFVELQDECQVYKSKQINTYDDNLFGECFTKRGFTVTSDKGRQHGELQDKSDMNGIKVEKLRNNVISNAANNDLLKRWKQAKNAKNKVRPTKGTVDITLFDVIDFLQGYLVTYYKVRHLRHIEKPVAPSNVYQMLQWLLGLWYHPVCFPLRVSTMELFPKPKGMEGKTHREIGSANLKLEAYPHTLTPNGFATKLLENVCLYSNDVLIAILGHGHAGGRYACDFYTNEDNLDYPSSAALCFDMLVDVSFRVYEQLYFLFVQCSRTYESNSWQECWYGQGIAGSSWTCNEKQCGNQNCPQLADQKANQNAGQRANQSAALTCDLHSKCGLKSPLQSFLEDGLQGFLPHQFEKPGCKLTCTVSKHGGIPCKTPMGFSYIGSISSHTKQGEHIAKALDAFCGQVVSPLSKFCAYLVCLLQRPPQNLSDMFSFYNNFLYGWENAGKDHRSDAFDSAVTKAYFGVSYEELDPSLLFSSSHSAEHKSRDLFSLLCHGDNKTVTTCGRYLQPISANTWTLFSKQNGDKYLSWIVYLSESFYNLLDQLYKECCKNCTSAGSRCHGKTCVADCKVRSHYASLASAAESKTPAPAPTDHHHNQLCKPISHCPFTRPTFCKYGFVLKSLSNMSGDNGEETMRTCKDLCNALQKVLSDKIDDGAPLAKLVHETIPNFLFKIREPFIWLNVALWLLSVLYLLHIMVIRLDLLHIKSHLHSPSSHRIAAQSLLAAARVNKLNRVFYLQP